jgi:hypothetical protein
MQRVNNPNNDHDIALLRSAISSVLNAINIALLRSEAELCKSGLGRV